MGHHLKTALPALMRPNYAADFRNPEEYFLTAYDLMLSLYGYTAKTPGIKDWRDELAGSGRGMIGGEGW